MQRKSLLLLTYLALVGCTTGPSLQSRMEAYVGANSRTLVQTLGVPDKHITVNGVQYLTYVNVTARDYGSGGWYGSSTGLALYNGEFYGSNDALVFYIGGYPPIYSCETTFMLKDDRVYNLTFRGNDCG